MQDKSKLVKRKPTVAEVIEMRNRRHEEEVAAARRLAARRRAQIEARFKRFMEACMRDVIQANSAR